MNELPDPVCHRALQEAGEHMASRCCCCFVPWMGAGTASPDLLFLWGMQTPVLPTEKPPWHHFSHSPKEEILLAGKCFEGEHPPPHAQGLSHLLGVTPLQTRQTRRLPTFRLVVAQRAGSAGTGVRARAPRTARAAQGA